MVIIFAIFLTTVLANSQEKYIDFLPDDEKQEFLNTIARRMMKTDDSNEELHENFDFTKFLLNEDSGPLIRRKGDKTFIKEENDSSEDILIVKPLKTNSSINNANNKMVSLVVENQNLTAGNIKRRKNDEDLQEKSAHNSNVIFVTKQANKVTLQESTATTESESVLTEREHSDKKSNQEEKLNSQKESTGDSKLKIVMKNETNFETIRKTDALDSRESFPSTLKSSFEEIKTTNPLTQHENKNDNTFETQSQISEIKHEDDFLTNTAIVEESKTSKTWTPSSEEFDLQETSDSTLINLSNENTTGLIATATYGTARVSSTLTSPEYITSTASAIEYITATTEAYRSLTERPLINKDLTKELKTENVKQSDIPNDLGNTENLNNIIQVTDINKAENERFINENEVATEENSNVNHYRVYEIPSPTSPEDQPFIKNPEPINDPRFQIPEYQYFPKNTQNTESTITDKNKEEPETQINDDEMTKQALKKHLIKEMRKFAKYRTKKVKRTKSAHIKKGTDVSYDTSPSFNELRLAHRIFNDGSSTHARKARDVIRRKQSLNPLENDDYVNSFDADKSSMLRARYDDIKDIDIDYYFGRMNRRYKKNNKVRDHKSQAHAKPNEHLGHINNHMHDILFGKHKPKYSKQKADKNAAMKSKYVKLAKIFNTDDEKEFVVNYKKLQDMNLKLMKRNFDVKIETYMKVLKDMMVQDSIALKQYGWLATTVQIQQTLSNMFQIINRMREAKPLHPDDVQLIKYVVFIYNLSSDIRKANKFGNELKKHIKHKLRKKMWKKNKLIEDNGLINRGWLYMNTLVPDLTAKDEITDLYNFLLDVGKGLFDLHEALMNIAKVTKFNNQHWYDNLKELYLTTEEKHLRELLLHISFSKIIDLIEYGTQNGLEDNFISYVKRNPKESKRIVEEVLFVSKIVDEIKSNVN